MRRRWQRRTIAAAVTFVALFAVLALIQTDPDPVRLALLVAVSGALAGLGLDALEAADASWKVEVERPSSRSSGDPRLARNVALIEAHLSARGAEPALRDRLAQLTDRVLRQRHGLGIDDPAAEALLGPELRTVLLGPPRLLGRTEIERCLTTIEEL